VRARYLEVSGLLRKMLAGLKLAVHWRSLR